MEMGRGAPLKGRDCPARGAARRRPYYFLFPLSASEMRGGIFQRGGRTAVFKLGGQEILGKKHKAMVPGGNGWGRGGGPMAGPGKKKPRSAPAGGWTHDGGGPPPRGRMG